MTVFVRVVSVVILLGLAILCHQAITNSNANQILKEESAEINHIKYGLFSVDVWKQQLETIVSEEIGDFDLSANEKVLRSQVESQLAVLIDKVANRIRESNQGSFKGRLKQAFINAVVDVDDIKKGIPQYSEAIMAELKKAKNERQLKRAVKRQVAKYFDKTFENQDKTDLELVLSRLGTQNIVEAKEKVSAAIAEKQKLVTEQSWLMIGLAIVLFALVIFTTRGTLTPWSYVTMSIALLFLLAAGVGTPMIDMEAKLGQMSFVLLDHEITFENQILYFQSKSIMDVFWVMVRHPDIPMKIVGILVVTFSVVFPVTKMISACLVYFRVRRLEDNPVVKFFALKSGKWSMSDVLVVAIFMSYVGFNGIIESQLNKLTTLAKGADLLTTNGTSLQPGFFLFLTYVMLGLILSTLITRESKTTV